MISSSNQMSVSSAIGLSAVTAAAANETVRSAIMSGVSWLGRSLCSIPGQLANNAVWCADGIRNQGFKAVSYLMPSLKPLAEREVAVNTLVRPFSSIVSGSGAKATGSISTGSLGWAGITPLFYLTKTGVNTCRRYLRSHQHYKLANEALNNDSANASAALACAERVLTNDAGQYRKLSERSVLTGWKGLLMAAVPAILLAPELGAAAVAAGVVAGVSQITSNAWEKWANSSMLNQTQEHIQHVRTRLELLELKAAVYNFDHRITSLENARPGGEV